MNEQNFRVVIAEDEDFARDALANLIAATPGWQVVARARDGVDALASCLKLAPDLLVADIRMPRLDGLELAAELRAIGLPTEIVFITAHDAHALSAFRVAALDYLLKPLADQALQDCLTRVRARLQSRGRIEMDGRGPLDAFLQTRRASIRHIAVRSPGRLEIVPLADVIAICAQGNYAELITLQRTWLHRETMVSLAARLDPQRFVPIHRSTIVAVASVRRIERDGPIVHVHLRNGLCLRASPRGAQRLERAIDA